MAGHIAGGVSTAYYADKYVFDIIKDAESVSEEFTRLGNSMAAAAVSCYAKLLCLIKTGLQSYLYTNVNRTYNNILMIIHKTYVC